MGWGPRKKENEKDEQFISLQHFKWFADGADNWIEILEQPLHNPRRRIKCREDDEEGRNIKFIANIGAQETIVSCEMSLDENLSI